MRKRFYPIVSVLVGATLMALFMRLFVVEDFRVASDSMVPGLLTGDLVFVSKLSYNLKLPFSSYEVVRFRSPERSEVVALTLPDQKNKVFIKRVIALAGDTVEIKDGVLSINGHEARYKFQDVSEPEAEASVRQVAKQSGTFAWEDIGAKRVYEIVADKGLSKDYGPVDIPPDHFFVLGDNRVSSVDSRVLGPIPNSCIEGRVVNVWMSVDALGSIRSNRIGKWVK